MWQQIKMMREFIQKQRYPQWNTVAKEMNVLCRYAWLLVSLILLAYVPLLFISEWPGRDVAGRYAPMAEAFASGDFLYAFHPRCQSFHTTVAGCIAYLASCSGYLACKLTSFLFFVLSFFPLYAIMKRLFGVPAARGTILLFACCAPVVNLLAVSGERDCAKMFIQLLMTYSITEIFFEREKLRYYILLGVAGGLAICTRSDLMLITALFLFLCGILERYKYPVIRRTLIALSFVIAVSSLELLANFHSTDYVIPGTRFYYLIEEFFHAEPSWSIWYLYICIPGILLFTASVYLVHFLLQKKAGRILLISAGILFAAGLVAGAFFLAFKPASNLTEYLQSLAEGFSPVIFPLAVAGILFRKMTKQWTKAETLLFLLFLTLDLAILVQVAVTDKRLFLSPRYIVPALPLLLGWCWIFCCAVSRVLAENISFLRNKYLLYSLLCLSVLFAIFLGYRKEINLHLRPRDARYLSALKEISRILRKEKLPDSDMKPNLFYYRSPKRPFVVFDCPGRLAPAAYLGGGSTASFYTPIDILVTDASKAEWVLRTQFMFQGQLKKSGEPIPFGNRKLQVWKHVIP